MKPSKLKSLLLMGAMVPTIAFGSNSNPFNPSQDAANNAHLEEKIDNLERLIMDREMRANDPANFPGIDPREFGEDGKGDQGAPLSEEIHASDIVIGKVNGKCLIKRTWAHGGETIEALDITEPCINKKVPSFEEALGMNGDVVPSPAALKTQAHATVKHQTTTRAEAEAKARAEAAKAKAAEEAKKIEAANRAQVESKTR